MAAAIFEFLTTGKSHLDGAMLHFDVSNFKTHLFQIQQAPSQTSSKSRIIALDASILRSEDLYEELYELIDVRETFEHEEFNVGGKCLPAGNIREWENELNLHKTPLFYCNYGHQSSIVAQYIATRFPELQIAHLKNGVESLRLLS